MIEARPLTGDDRLWALEVETDSWGVPVVARLGELVDPTGLSGFVASVDGERAGLVTYAVRGDACEVVTIRSSARAAAWAEHSWTRCARLRSRPAAGGSGWSRRTTT